LIAVYATVLSSETNGWLMATLCWVLDIAWLFVRSCTYP
jgi:hypothetical protein